MKINLLIVISLMVVMSAAMVAPVMAGNTTTITGNPGAVIDISVTGSITDWALVVGDNTRASDVVLNVSSNYYGWVVSVKDASDNGKPPSWAGRMVEWDGSSAYVTPSPKVLGANMTVTGTSVTGTSGSLATLSKDNEQIEYGNDVVSARLIPITIGQEVAYTDPTLTVQNHVYRIVVTFTGTTP